MTQPRPICLVTTDLTWGGAERIVYELAVGLRDRGESVVVVGLGRDGHLRERLNEARIQTHSLGADKPRHARAEDFDRIVAELEPRVVHGHLFHANRVVRRSRTTARIITTEHSCDPRFLPHRVWIDRRLAPRSSAIVCVSSAVAEYYRARVPRAERLCIIPNGVAWPASITDRPERAERYRFGFLGRLNRAKGADLLLRAFPQAGCELHVGGVGPLTRAFEGRARATAHVQLHGFVRALDDFFTRFDTLLVPSRTEGFGLVALEAMARGVPVCLSNAKALHDLAGGILPPDAFFPPTVAGLRAACERAPRLQDDTHRRLLDVPDEWRQRYSLDRMIESYRALYAKLDRASDSHYESGS